MTRIEIKKYSKSILKDNISMFFLILLSYTLAIVVSNFVPFFGWLATLLITPLYLFTIIKLVNRSREGLKKTTITELFEGLNADFFVINIGIKMIISIIIFLGTVLIGLMFFASLLQGNLFIPILFSVALIIANVYLSYCLFLIPYDSFNGAKLSEFDRYIRNSFKLMKGHKLDLMVQHFSFVGWGILISVIGCFLININVILAVVVIYVLSMLLSVYINIADVIFAQNVMQKLNIEKVTVEVVD